MTQALVDIRLLNVSFNTESAEPVLAAKDLNFDIPKGEFTVLAGESGSGKTVSALSITGLVPSASVRGNIRWNGTGGPVDLEALSGEALRVFRGRRIGYVFQDPSSAFSPVERLGAQMMRIRSAHFGENQQSLRRMAIECLKNVSFSDPERIFESYPHELSGGMRQRAAIASALIAEPELLIADEPTTALDPVTETEIVELLEALRRSRGLTILFITHDLLLAEHYAYQIHVMRRGEKVETLIRSGDGIRPHTAYAKALFATGCRTAQPKSYLEVPRAT